MMGRVFSLFFLTSLRFTDNIGSVKVKGDCALRKQPGNDYTAGPAAVRQGKRGSFGDHGVIAPHSYHCALLRRGSHRLR
jgi:hypothetical protein